MLQIHRLIVCEIGEKKLLHELYQLTIGKIYPNNHVQLLTVCWRNHYVACDLIAFV